MIRLLFLLTTISGFCQTANETLSDCEITTIALNSGPFAPWHDAEEKGGPVVIYDGAHDGKPKDPDCREIAIGRKGNVIIKPQDFKAAIGESNVVNNPRIVLHKLEKTEAGFTVGFFYTELNWTLTLFYNDKGELLDYSSGAF